MLVATDEASLDTTHTAIGDNLNGEAEMVKNLERWLSECLSTVHVKDDRQVAWSSKQAKESVRIDTVGHFSKPSQTKGIRMLPGTVEVAGTL